MRMVYEMKSKGKILQIIGEGQEKVEEVIEYVRLPESLVGAGEFFVLIAKGDSMIEDGIHREITLPLESKIPQTSAITLWLSITDSIISRSLHMRITDLVSALFCVCAKEGNTCPLR